tara:strand:+ start:20913 stop:21161 length:249 start_codon:yes stop_codon:yes gene_type:complete
MVYIKVLGATSAIFNFCSPMIRLKFIFIMPNLAIEFKYLLNFIEAICVHFALLWSFHQVFKQLCLYLNYALGKIDKKALHNH